RTPSPAQAGRARGGPGVFPSRAAGVSPALSVLLHEDSAAHRQRGQRFVVRVSVPAGIRAAISRSAKACRHDARGWFFERHLLQSCWRCGRLAPRRQALTPSACRLGNSFMTNQAVQFFLSHFGLTVGQIDALLATALARGGDYADLYFEYR